MKNVRNSVTNAGRKIATGSALALVGMGSAMAAVDTTEIEAAIDDVQTKGVAIAGAVTLMVFLIAAAKWLRRAK